MVPAFDAGLTRFRASRPHRSGMVIDSPHGCLGVRPASKAGTMGNQTKVLVTGAGGFIGHHLVSYLKSLGYWVRGADAKAPEFCANAADEFKLVDLRRWEDCLAAATGIDEVYALAADMGGMGFIWRITRKSSTTIRSSTCTRSKRRGKAASSVISTLLRRAYIRNIAKP